MPGFQSDALPTELFRPCSDPVQTTAGYFCHSFYVYSLPGISASIYSLPRIFATHSMFTHCRVFLPTFTPCRVFLPTLTHCRVLLPLILRLVIAGYFLPTLTHCRVFLPAFTHCRVFLPLILHQFTDGRSYAGLHGEEDISSSAALTREPVGRDTDIYFVFRRTCPEVHLWEVSRERAATDRQIDRKWPVPE